LPLPPVPPELAAVLPDGFITEIAPAAVNYWRETASKLKRGKLLAIDYGSNEFLRPDRPNGTLRAYYRHHPAADLLANPGAQDITADVNFSALDKAGQTQDLTPAIQRRQSLFLTEIWAKNGQKPQSPSPRQFQTLTHPNHLGHLFHFLIQSTREI
jgi:SAM-dependent MidA family methyltransferase